MDGPIYTYFSYLNDEQFFEFIGVIDENLAKYLKAYVKWSLDPSSRTTIDYIIAHQFLDYAYNADRQITSMKVF